MFASVLSLLSSLLLLLSLFLPSLLVLLSSACPLACLVCSCVIVGFVFSFSLTDYTQKERALRVGASSLVLLWVCLDVIKHYRYFLRFIVTVSIPFANDSCDRFRRFRWVVYNLPVVVNC